MNEYIILVVIGMVAVISAVFTVLYFHYRREIEQKDRGLIRQLREQDCLAKELEHAQVKNETLEQLLNKMLDVSHNPVGRPVADVRRGKTGKAGKTKNAYPA
jgi:predicted Holliday junction resolvase-like endonuclease